MKDPSVPACAVVCAALVTSTHGAFVTIINAPPTVVQANTQLLSDTQLNVFEGGVVGQGLRFGLADGSSTNLEMNVTGGQVGRNLVLNAGSLNLSGGTIDRDAIAQHNATVSMSGGSISNGLRFFGNATLTMSGGVLGSDNEFRDDSRFTMFSGSVGDFTEFFGQNAITIGGGTIGDRMLVRGESHATISGGTFGERFGIDEDASGVIVDGTFGPNFFAEGEVHISGGRFDDGAFLGAQTTISGGEFGASARVRGGAVIEGGRFATDLRISGQIMPTTIRGGVFERGSTFESVGDASLIELAGTDFRLDGLPIDGTLDTLEPDAVFTAVLSDGTPLMLTGFGDVRDEILRDGLSLIEQAPSPITQSEFDVATGVAPSGLREGQVLRLSANGQVPDGFTALDSTIEVTGGTIAPSAEIARTTLTAENATIQDGLLAADGSFVTLRAGATVGEGLGVLGGSALHVEGGVVGHGLSLRDGARLTLTGGTIGRDFSTQGDVMVDLFGGSIDGGWSIHDANVHIEGTTLVGGGRFTNSNVELLEGTIGAGPNMSSSIVRAGTFTQTGGSVVGGLDLTHGAVGQLVRGEIDAVTVLGGSSFELVGGEIGRVEVADTGSSYHMTSGTIRDELRVLDGGSVVVEGGRVGGLAVFGTAEFRGGAFGASGTVGTAGEAGMLRLVGGDFRVDGIPVSIRSGGFEVEPGQVFTGELSDGTPFVISPSSNISIHPNSTIELVEASRPVNNGEEIAVDFGLAPLGLRRGQRLILSGTGEIGRSFTAVDAEVRMISGSVGEGLQLVGTSLEVTNGRFFGSVLLHRGTEATFFGGRADEDIFVFDDAMISNNGGDLFTTVRLNDQSKFTQSSGRTSLMTLRDSSSAVFTGGSIFQVTLSDPGASATITGETAVNNILANDGSVSVSGGIVTNVLSANGGSLSISSGVINTDIFVSNARLTITGGTFDSGPLMNRIVLTDASRLDLFVQSLTIDGQPIPLELGETAVITERKGRLLRAILADGSEFDLQLNEFSGTSDVVSPDSRLRVTLVPSPSGGALLLCYTLALYRRRKEDRLYV